MPGLLLPDMHLAIDWMNPVNWQHPLARGLQAWLCLLPGRTYGPLWQDLCQRRVGTLIGFDQPSSTTSGWQGLRANSRPGAFGRLLFDGTDDYVEVADAASLKTLTAFTIEAWFYFTTASQYKAVLNKFGGGAPLRELAL